MPVKHEKHRNGNTLLDEPAPAPTPFNAYSYGAVGNSAAPATPGPQHQDLPAAAAGYPNPWGSTPPTTEAARSTSPPAPTSEGSMYSGTALSGEQSAGGAHRALRVQNPTPAVPMSMPPADVKDRTVFLSADRGLQVVGPSAAAGASGSSSGAYPPAPYGQPGPSSSSAAAAPYQHQDAGLVPVPVAQVPPQAQPQRPRKAAEGSADVVEPGDAPPAYEA